jgi:phosphopentomutase
MIEMPTQLDRIILIILDGVGVGALPDAAQYGPPEADPQANCLGNTARAIGGLALPNLGALGLGEITFIIGTPGTDIRQRVMAGLDDTTPIAQPEGIYGRMAERSAGKDSTTGHWEIAGIVLDTPFPTYPHGFPPEVIAHFEAAIGRTVLGNRPASGTVIIQELGEEHLRTGSPIVYTSADSVFQIAAHEGIVPLEELYRWCAIAREQLQPPHSVGRVIARPFTGTPGNFTRTPHRRDFSLPPPQPTLLDVLHGAGYDVIGLGKIGDLFAGRGLTHSEHPGTDAETMDLTLRWLERDWRGLLFVNLVECDQVYGHRRNPQGYAGTLSAIDAWIPDIRARLGPTDAIFITGDHGTDPTVAGTDHTREYVPVLGYGAALRAGVNIGTRSSFADLGATIAAALGLDHAVNGDSFWNVIKR